MKITMSERQYQLLLYIVGQSAIRQRREKEEGRQITENENKDLRGVRQTNPVYQNT